MRQEYSARPKPAIPCSESDCSSWPSAKTVRGGWERDRNGNVYPTLEGLAENWVGPRVPQGGANSNRKARKAGGPDLQEQAQNWAGPCAMNHKGSSEGSIIRQDGKSRADLLHYQAEQLFTLLPSSPDQPIAGGSMSSIAGPNSNQPSVKRRLNPIFVEALMRWPTGLSGFARPETAWTRWWQLMPSYLLMLCSTAEPAQGELALREKGHQPWEFGITR